LLATLSGDINRIKNRHFKLATSANTTAKSGIIAKTKKLQEEFSKLVVLMDTLDKEPTNFCGIDVAYSRNVAYCSAVLINTQPMRMVKNINKSSLVINPYIPGYLMLRESEALLTVLKHLRSSIDVLLIDGHGVLHPRKCGLASYVGILLDVPTIGVAKSLLCGVITADHSILIDGIPYGFELIKANKKPIYVSVGHKLTLETAVRIVCNLILPKERIPEPLRLADRFSKNQAKSSKS
jgi:deoxyinosine 3'endonuclease (endonuclease V)